MGRRATSSTKGGRYMNPADQERKANRKRELKKNKKQRVLVRQAVLKSKDPQQIIEEMEKLDEMEFNANETPPLSERVIQEKRSKLRETFTRVMGMYRRDNENEKFVEMKKFLQEYDRKRLQLEQHYIAVKFARDVDPGEIPLPDAAPPPPDAAAAMTPIVAALHHIQQQGPFPPHFMMGVPFGHPNYGKAPPQGILKKNKLKSSLPPGVPLGLAPELSDDDDDDLVDEEGQIDETSKRNEKASAKVRFNAEGDEELNEKDSRTKYKELAKKIAAGERMSDEQDEMDDGDMLESSFAQIHAASTFSGVGMRPMISPMRQLAGPQMQSPPMGFPSRMRPGMRMPPPPMGFPPGNFQRPFIGPSHPSNAPSSSGAVLTAPPTVQKPKHVGPIIEAKPQLRNMQHEVTKLIPTAVKIRRETHANVANPGHHNPLKGPIVFRTSAPGSQPNGSATKPKTADDAYDQFMKEVQGLL